MGRILPSTDGATITRGTEPTVLFFDEDRAEEVLSGVQSETARRVLCELIEEPMPASELADQLELTVESVSYHLGNLEERELIQVYTTVYSEKGREMAVYGVAEDPVVLVFGSIENEEHLRATFSKLATLIGPMATLLAIKQSFPDIGELTDIF